MTLSWYLFEQQNNTSNRGCLDVTDSDSFLSTIGCLGVDERGNMPYILASWWTTSWKIEGITASKRPRLLCNPISCLDTQALPVLIDNICQLVQASRTLIFVANTKYLSLRGLESQASFLGTITSVMVALAVLPRTVRRSIAFLVPFAYTSMTQTAVQTQVYLVLLMIHLRRNNSCQTERQT